MYTQTIPIIAISLFGSFAFMFLVFVIISLIVSTYRLKICKNQMMNEENDLTRFSIDPSYTQYGATMKNSVIAKYNQQVTNYNTILDAPLIGSLLRMFGHTKLSFKEYLGSTTDEKITPIVIQHME